MGVAADDDKNMRDSSKIIISLEGVQIELPFSENFPDCAGKSFSGSFALFQGRPISARGRNFSLGFPELMEVFVRKLDLESLQISFCIISGSRAKRLEGISGFACFRRK